MDVFEIPSLEVFDNDWELLQKFLKRRNYPYYSIGGNLFLKNLSIPSLHNLVAVYGHLSLDRTKIDSLGCLRLVEGYVSLIGCSVKDLGELKYVGGNLFLSENTPLKDYTSSKEIYSKIYVGGTIFYML